MNLNLKKEIIKHIFDVVGLYESNYPNKLTASLVGDNFLLDKKIQISLEDGAKLNNNIWGSLSKIDNSVIKILIADISDDIKEFAVILQMDNFYPHAFRLSEDEEDHGSVAISVDGVWIEAPILSCAQILVGIESLSQTFLSWDKIKDYADMHKAMISFLSYLSADE